jgi:hypothetical protein
MEFQDGAGEENVKIADTSSPNESGSSKGKLQLPLSCDPPGPANPAKPLVWIVSLIELFHSSFLVLVSREYYESIWDEWPAFEIPTNIICELHES